MSGPAVSPYSRIDKNRFETRLILVFFGALLIPVLVFLVSYLSAWLFLLAPWAFVGGTENPAPSDNLGYIARVAPYVGAAAFLIGGLVIWRVVAVARSLPAMMGAIPCPPEEGRAIWRRLENLALAAGLPVPRLFLLPSKNANAFATGPDPTRASVVVTTGLLEVLSQREFDAVLAHELAHIRNHDTRINSTVASILRTATLPAPIWWVLVIGMVLVVLGMLGGGIGLIHSVLEMMAEVPPEMLWLLLGWMAITLLALAWPIIGRVIQSVLSRTREFLADAEAVTMTRDPVGLARALARIAGGPSTKLQRSIGIEHLCIAPPHAERWSSIFPSHPPTSARISALQGMAPLEPESLTEQRPDPELKAAGDRVLASADSKNTRLPSEAGTVPIRAVLNGSAAGCVVATAVYVLNLVFLVRGAVARPIDVRSLSPTAAFGISGAVAAYAAMRTDRRFAWWPIVVMFFFGPWLGFAVVTSFAPGTPTLSAFLVTYLAALIEPVVGSVLGAMVISSIGQRRHFARRVGPPE